MATDPGAIDAAFYDRLREHYSEEEIVELGAFAGFNIGYHTFFGTLKFYPMFSPDGKKIAFSSNRNNGGGRDTNIFVADWVD